MITEDKLRRCILKAIEILKYTLFKILYLQVALIIVLLWAITYGIIYVASGFHAHVAIDAGFIFFLYPVYVIYKNSVSFYKWLYQK